MRIALGALLALPVVAMVVLGAVAKRVDRKLNRVYRSTPYKPSARGVATHAQAFIADLHADPLLWSRDLLARGKVGHVDVPRLLEGNVGLVVFGAVTKTPTNMNVHRNDDSSDQIRLLAIAQRWPPSTYVSLKARALHLADRLHDSAKGSKGQLAVVRSRGELETFLEARRQDPRRVAGLLALEGMHALEGEVASVDTLFAAGYRMLGIAHFFDNEMGGSAHGVAQGGLTALGEQALSRMEALGMTLDLAHASPKTFADALEVATRPVVVSHTGVRGTCDSPRNLTDAQLRAVAKNGGVVGIGFWKTATCGTDADAIVRAVLHAVKVAGVDHVGLGSDFDGAVATPFDAAGMVELTDRLQANGLEGEALAKVLGGNVLRVLRANLPE